MNVNPVSLVGVNNSVNFTGRKDHRPSDVIPREQDKLVTMPMSYLRAIALGGALVVGGAGLIGATGCGGGGTVSTQPTDPTNPTNPTPTITKSEKAVADMFSVLGLMSTTTKSSAMRASAMYATTSAASTGVAAGTVTDFSYHNDFYDRQYNLTLNKDLTNDTQTVYDGTQSDGNSSAVQKIRYTYTVDTDGSIVCKRLEDDGFGQGFVSDGASRYVVDADRHVVVEKNEANPKDKVTITYTPVTPTSVIGEFSSGGTFRDYDYKITLAK